MCTAKVEDNVFISFLKFSHHICNRRKHSHHKHMVHVFGIPYTFLTYIRMFGPEIGQLKTNWMEFWKRRL